MNPNSKQAINQHVVDPPNELMSGGRLTSQGVGKLN